MTMLLDTATLPRGMPMGRWHAGDAPHDLGRFDVAATEMMFVQYLPVVMAEASGTVPDLRLPMNVESFRPLVDAALRDGWTPGHYAYLTAKHFFVPAEGLGNRPGWHIDGFGTDDLNYVWCDRAPTEFCVQPFALSTDCGVSMLQMSAQVQAKNVRTYPTHHLLRLTNRVVHRTAENAEAGLRTFVKVSISKDRYNLAGNAHNPLFDYAWPMMARASSRNHPAMKG